MYCFGFLPHSHLYVTEWKLTIDYATCFTFFLRIDTSCTFKDVFVIVHKTWLFVPYHNVLFQFWWWVVHELNSQKKRRHQNLIEARNRNTYHSSLHSSLHIQWSIIHISWRKDFFIFFLLAAHSFFSFSKNVSFCTRKY